MTISGILKNVVMLKKKKSEAAFHLKTHHLNQFTRQSFKPIINV